MLGCVLGVHLALASIQAEREHLLCMKEKLSSEEYQRYLDVLAKRMEEDKQHQRNLEVAKAGRSLNFWGE